LTGQSYVHRKTYFASAPSKTKETIYYVASSVPQELPAALAKEAVARGFAVKVESEKKNTKKSTAKNTADKVDLDKVPAGQTDAEIDFEKEKSAQIQSEESESEADQSDDNLGNNDE
jgi:hypothetical protein